MKAFKAFALAGSALAILILPSAWAQNRFAGNVPKPKPAFPGQTDAPPPSKPSPAIMVETVAGRLDAPFALAFLPDGNFLVTESAGRMRVVRPNGMISAPIQGVPDIKVVTAQGL